ncbi:hypothetical protein SASPL_104745 [Salvia splendens]|uniref:Uncharacterized protein n=1 Tax=Salvia splendens TaxID=180675 RepID=A0A8X9A8P6_SALSN|nr:hypothetical protein SASPL_104745 [Salvia splendens]
MDDPLFSDVFTSYDADEPSKNSNSNIFFISVYDKPVYDEDILSMPVYDKPIYDEDIFYELPGLVSKSLPPSMKFDNAVEDEGVAVDDNDELEEIVAMPQRKVTDMDVAWTDKEHELYDSTYLEDLPEFHKFGVLAKKRLSKRLSPCFPLWMHLRKRSP